jgi:hypothetical protein
MRSDIWHEGNVEDRGYRNIRVKLGPTTDLGIVCKAVESQDETFWQLSKLVLSGAVLQAARCARILIRAVESLRRVEWEGGSAAFGLAHARQPMHVRDIISGIWTDARAFTID